MKKLARSLGSALLGAGLLVGGSAGSAEAQIIRVPEVITASTSGPLPPGETLCTPRLATGPGNVEATVTEAYLAPTALNAPVIRTLFAGPGSARANPIADLPPVARDEVPFSPLQFGATDRVRFVGIPIGGVVQVCATNPPSNPSLLVFLGIE